MNSKVENAVQFHREVMVDGHATIMKVRSDTVNFMATGNNVR